MRIFLSQQPTKTVSHPTLKKAAGSVTFAVRFFDHRFATDNTAIADALAALVEAGTLPDVKEVAVSASPEQKPETSTTSTTEPEQKPAPTADPQATTGGTSSGKGKSAANGAN